jgi:hypothetical protein
VLLARSVFECFIMQHLQPFVKKDIVTFFAHIKRLFPVDKT